jgi:hypothetical protein
MNRTENGQARDLIRLRQRLDEYRRGSSPGKALPGWAWSEAGRLAQRHGVHRTARALGLEYNKLKRTSGAGPVAASAGRIAKHSSAHGAAVKFLELPSALPAVGQMCRVRLAGPAGERLELEMSPGAAKEVVLELCRAGWGSQP